MSDVERLNRWRLVMGAGSEDCCGGLSSEDARREACLDFLYDREYGSSRNVRGKSSSGGASGPRSAGLGESVLNVPDWINHVHELFPKKTVERLEKDAMERYQLDELVTNSDVLARAQPNVTLLKAVLRTKHLMNQQVLAMARKLVRKVVQELIDKLSREIRNPFQGAINRRRRSFVRIAKNFDIKRTVRENLKHYEPENRRVLIETPYFFSRVRRHTDRWQIITLVDQSGSMADSVIYASVCASIFFGIPAIRTHLCAFDTAVVDLSSDCVDPVETLMKVQLGGGTDIGQAMEYAATLVDNPRRTIVVLITDFFEGAPVSKLLGVTHKLISSGVQVLGLAALDQRAEPVFDRDLAGKMVSLGAHVAAMTPGELAAWVAQKVR